ncbi:VOC family protein [Thermocoleostomius sinensis]|jgi:extradiol dioxygenase family protein|uniref:VOC family protein n=1 Tax=Thermocoleostomius sinensis A174 TaxID=2016057 RepID=A0A9E8ZBZ3_9CYAN|nr:VOC family protein [Thermocoleostomius sinensis]WAL59129.1 VOC family protein [Thermocoleostomius sinensis A174]
MVLRPFHLAFPVKDLVSTRQFYETVLGCSIGRSSDTWIDFNFFGHQTTAHLCPDVFDSIATNLVDGKPVPVQHWGVILDMEQWQALADRLRQHHVEFVIEPYRRFQGEVGEQATLFILDPSGNALEFKAFQHDASIFATYAT